MALTRRSSSTAHDLWHHDLGMHVDAFLQALRGGLEDGADLHFVDLGIGETETHAAVPQHRIHFRQQVHLLQHRLAPLERRVAAFRLAVLLEALLQLAEALDVVAGQFRVEQLQRVRQLGDRLRSPLQVAQMADLEFELRCGRQELVHRRVEQAHGDRQSRQRGEDALEIRALDRQQLAERGAPLGRRLGEDHLLHDRQAVRIVEHALGAAEPDALRAVAARAGGVAGRIRIGHDLEPRRFVGPRQERGELVEELGFDGRDPARIHVAGRAVDA